MTFQSFFKKVLQFLVKPVINQTECIKYYQRINDTLYIVALITHNLNWVIVLCTHTL